MRFIHSAMVSAFILLSACAVEGPPPSPTLTTIPRGGEVPATEFARGATWTTGSKMAVGTAYTYQEPADVNSSRVWFTVTNGALSDVLYPTLDRPNVRELKFLISDGGNVFDETTDLRIEMSRPDPRALLWEISSTDKENRFRLTKTIIADPDSNALMIAARLDTLKSGDHPFNLYAYFMPLVGGTGKGSKLTLNYASHRTTVTGADVAATLLTDVDWQSATAGFLRVSDGLDDLKTNKRLSMNFDSATHGDYPTFIAQLPSNKTVTLVLGFGKNGAEAEQTASTSLARGFNSVRLKYVSGWENYVSALDPLSGKATSEYYLSAMLLRASEDKTYRGAVIASFAIPWGDQTLDDPLQREKFVGYRRVWARDSYHIAMGLIAAGDQATASAILNYLDNIQQLPTGGFPQNSYLDGSASWSGLQLDEVADPILLAWHLNAVERYASLVKPAADFLVKQGPSTPQERWEEVSGYSPATLGAEVAGLFAAADLATRAGDADSARVYKLFGTRWAMEIPLWSYTRSGTLGGKSYFVRIAPNGRPDGQDLVGISNNVNVDQRALVDPSFLELVRLGLFRPNDPLVTSTLQVVDDSLRVQTLKGPSWYRYQGDRYGERDRTTLILDKGHLWPLLTGERAIYEFAAGRTENAMALSDALAKFANAGGMIPEQVWEDSGTGTGSATPLLWAHAEYVVMLKTLASGKIIDQPSIVADYLK